MNREQILQSLVSLNMRQSVLSKICEIPITKLNQFLKGHIQLESHELSRIISAIRVCSVIESGRGRLSDLLPVDWSRVARNKQLESVVFRGVE